MFKYNIYGWHGICSDGSIFNPLVRYCEEYNCALYSDSLPGHSRTIMEPPDPDLAGYNLKDYLNYYVEKYNRHIRRQRGKNFNILMGHSMGGLLAAMAVSLRLVEPDLLVLLTPAMPAGYGNSLTLDRAIIFFPWWMPGWRSKSVIHRNLYSTWYGVFPHDITYQEAKAAHQLQGYESRLVLDELGYNPPEVNFDRIECPILMICGNLDRIVDPKMQKKLVEDNPQISARFIDAPHYLFWYPEWCRQVINICFSFVKQQEEQKIAA